ncbi:hypothetical protein VNO80_09933 [Phaseolus coccineus]|uniref:Uncharacterized protein n=1 Tax=Phaseolus coccineus TaxID=3886 RepID=A0AAN9NDK5_PHACN
MTTRRGEAMGKMKLRLERSNPKGRVAWKSISFKVNMKRRFMLNWAVMKGSNPKGAKDNYQSEYGMMGDDGKGIEDGIAAKTIILPLSSLKEESLINVQEPKLTKEGTDINIKSYLT